MELGVIVGGRWRSLCAHTGRVEGWRRRATLAVLRHGALWPAPLTSLVDIVRGPRLYPLPTSPLPRSPEHRCANVNGTPTDPWTSSSSAASLDKDVQTAWSGNSPQHAASRHVATQTDGDGAAINSGAGAAIGKGAGGACSAGAFAAVGAGAGGAGGGGECRELLVDAQAVRLLRKYARKHTSLDIDPGRFDQDDQYKALVFFKINPLVRVERCPKIAKMLQDRDNPQATEYFARQLGLCSNVENGSELQSGDTSGHKKVTFQGSLVTKKVCRSGATVWREYSEEEDRAMVRWLLADEWRVRAVNGNRVWRELELAFPALTRTNRSWHSLRNRYLRYLLPSLDSPALQLAPSAARHLREGAALGEMKARRCKYSPAPAPAPRGAFSRRPPAPPRVSAATPSPRVSAATPSPRVRAAASPVRLRRGGRSLLSPPALQSPPPPKLQSPTLRSRPPPKPQSPTLRSRPPPKPQSPTLRSRPPPKPQSPTLRSRSPPTPQSPTLRSRPPPKPQSPTLRSRSPPTLQSPTLRSRPPPTLQSPTLRSPILPTPLQRQSHLSPRTLRPRSAHVSIDSAGSSTQAAQPRVARIPKKRRLYNPMA